MEEKFNNKYRASSNRLQCWDYSQDGAYFVTICIHNKECSLGTIIEVPDFVNPRKIELSEIGIVAGQEWRKIECMRSNVELGAYIIMPNHIHGIIFIQNIVETQCLASQSSQEIKKTHSNASLQNTTSIKKTHSNASLQLTRKNQFGPQSNNLSSIIRGFKSAVKTYATMNKIPFQWQPRFYDHIIRDDKSLDKIREYIHINPLKWHLDQYNPNFKK